MDMKQTIYIIFFFKDIVATETTLSNGTLGISRLTLMLLVANLINTK